MMYVDDFSIDGKLDLTDETNGITDELIHYLSIN